MMDYISILNMVLLTLPSDEEERRIAIEELKENIDTKFTIYHTLCRGDGKFFGNTASEDTEYPHILNLKKKYINDKDIVEVLDHWINKYHNIIILNRRN